ncbi:MAG TPA: class I SAM-dependent methyltransferase [Solirubrobacteraceae bacterium]|nr:class I SAM-dependent methyltransferase [Solirubrobacteraceae bacterium]
MLDRGSSLVKESAFVVADGPGDPLLRHVPENHPLTLSEGLERLHGDISRTHFIDIWTRRAMLSRLGRLPMAPTVIDLGCSTGQLLADLRALLPDATLIGVDLAAPDLRAAHLLAPDALLLQADVCALPLKTECVDTVMSANVLEHVADDRLALGEMYRVLRPGGRAVLVVPAHPGSYDFHDRLHGHTRRYARGELARKASLAGFELLQDIYLGALLFPAFWMVKQRNRRREAQLDADVLEEKVDGDTERTAHSRLGHFACRLEALLLIAGVRLPFGIRGLTVLERPLVNT